MCIGIRDTQDRFGVVAEQCLCGDAEPVAYRFTGWRLVCVEIGTVALRRTAIVPADTENSGLETQPAVE